MPIKSKILIVEDERPLAKALDFKLSNAGFDAAVVYDGDEALAAIKEQKYDLLLLDLMMPRLNGYEVLKTLKKNKNNIPVVVLSNFGQDPEIDLAIKLGAKHFFAKTVTPISNIVEFVKNYLKKTNKPRVNAIV